MCGYECNDCNAQNGASARYWVHTIYNNSELSMSVTNVSKYLGADGLMIGRVAVGVYLLCIAVCGQQLASTWQEDVRRYAEAKNWSAAMAIVDREINRAPRDMDVRAWRARVLMWSGKLAEAELEYYVLVTAAPNDPDNWLGLATLYLGKAERQRLCKHWTAP
jgi:tetratricopeptide (TPR) repeat protein